jgi:long-chain acyl-CoA synthetase
VATFNQAVFGRKPGTVGRAIWGTDAEIAAPEIEDRIELLPIGEIGEVVMRGHHIFAGYLGNPEATAAVLVDGWFRSETWAARTPTGSSRSSTARRI